METFSPVEGRVVIVTGAARGLGKAHALAFARAGAKVIVNDLGVEADGTTPSSTDSKDTNPDTKDSTPKDSAPKDNAPKGSAPKDNTPKDAASKEDTPPTNLPTNTSSQNPAAEVVQEITDFGGTALANYGDVADWDSAKQMIEQALDSWGRLDTLVLNAGFLRDRMLAGMSEEEFDQVIRVHIKGHFAPARFAIEYWRERSKAGENPEARVINTSSGAGLMGSIGQGNYAAAKAAIATLTIQEAAEWERYGVLVNAIAPDARTRMTEGIFYTADDVVEGHFDEKDPANASPLVVWLGSGECDVTGRVFEITGGQLNVCDGWQHSHVVDVGKRRFELSEMKAAVHKSIENSPAPAPVYGVS